VLLVWTLRVIPVVHIPLPILIKKGMDLPLILLLAGFIGGLLAFGILDLFVGSVVINAVHGMD